MTDSGPNAGPTMNFLIVFTHALDQCFVTSEYVDVVKAMHTANMHITLLESLLSDVSNVLERFGMMDTQAIDVVTFDFRGTRVLWVVSGSIGYQMNFD